MNAVRTLRRPRARRRLYQAANGFCQLCGAQLDEHFQADHIIPWRVRRRTNPHEMQALCRWCNTWKGGRLLSMTFSPRTFQSEVRDITRNMATGVEQRRQLLAQVLPGGGKSSLPPILHHELRNLVERVCWVAPRVSLLDQAESAYDNVDLRTWVGHNLRIRQSTNEVNPSRSQQGFATTYQAIVADPPLLVPEFERFHYALVLDEWQHVERDGAWSRAIQPLIDRAAVVVVMSGGLERGDNDFIHHVPYGPDHRVLTTETPEWLVVNYGLQQALRERAVIEMDAWFRNGAGVWYDMRTQQQRQFDSLDAVSVREVPTALATLLRTDFALELLRFATTDYVAYRGEYAWSKMLVVATQQSDARTYVRELQNHQPALRVGLAVSDEGPAALETIRRFREPTARPSALDVLVTVQMAYEGLDVPAISHIACLTRIRSKPWIYQMLARAQRVAGPRQHCTTPWELQRARLFGPGDALLLQVWSEIQAEQLAAAQVAPAVTPAGSAGAGGGQTPGVGSIPLDGHATGDGFVSELSTGETLTPNRSAEIEAIQREADVPYMSPIIIDRLFRARDEHTARGGGPTGAVPDPIPVSQEERRLRDHVERVCRRLDRDANVPWGTHNGLMLAALRVPRGEMSVEQLRRAAHWVDQHETNGGHDGCRLVPST